ncbi:LOW QUALITY PROTEIN: calpain-14 [Ctenodactylus gundi]
MANLSSMKTQDIDYGHCVTKRKKERRPLGHFGGGQDQYVACLWVHIFKQLPRHPEVHWQEALLWKLPIHLQWKRPLELHSNPRFYAAKAKRLDVYQGRVDKSHSHWGPTPELARQGDYWFLAALQALTLHSILSWVVLLNQSFTAKCAGISQFWLSVPLVHAVIDDHPTVNKAGQLVFVSSTHKNLFWALLEKAYAKLCGSYEDLQFEQVSEAHFDFTGVGGVTMAINLTEAPGNLWSILTQATYCRTLIGCQAHLDERRLNSGRKERLLVTGLVAATPALSGIWKVTCKYGYLVKLRNSWEKVEWKGDWSDSSRTELLNPKEKILIRREDNDGEFWMMLRDFEVHFRFLVICELTPDLLSPEVGWKWTYAIKEGRQWKGSTTGARMDFLQGGQGGDVGSHGPLTPHCGFHNTFWKNLQFLLPIWRPEKGRKSLSPCSVLVSPLQKPGHRHQNWRPHLAIDFYLFWVSKKEQRTVLLVRSPSVRYQSPKGMGLGGTRPFFRLEAYQGILAPLDLNASGTVSIQEFRGLWKLLMLMPDVFQNLTQDGKGMYLYKPEWLMMALYSSEGRSLVCSY